jgi:hypothetical protein
MAKLARTMVLNRNLILESTYGHVIRFEKDKPVNVPPVMHGLALGIGAQFTDDKPAVEDTPMGPQEIVDPAERKAKLLEIVTAIIDRNHGDDFTAGGKPKAAAVSKAFGFEVTGREVGEIVQMYNEAQEASKGA